LERNYRRAEKWRIVAFPDAVASARSVTDRPRDVSRLCVCVCMLRATCGTNRAIDPVVSKNRGVFRGDFVCRPQPRPEPETLVCQPASNARSNYDQAILVETSEKRWRVTQGWHPEKGVRSTAEDHKRFGHALPEHVVATRRVPPAAHFLSTFPFRFSDINELNLPKTCGTEFPDPDDLLSFKLIICPDEVSKYSSGATYSCYD